MSTNKTSSSGHAARIDLDRHTEPLRHTTSTRESQSASLLGPEGLGRRVSSDSAALPPRRPLPSQAAPAHVVDMPHEEVPPAPSLLSRFKAAVVRMADSTIESIRDNDQAQAIGQVFETAKHFVAPVVGQSIQQVVTCFLPTVAREVVHLKIAQDLAEKPVVALAIQGGLYVLHMGAEVNRHRRLKEHPDVAARAFHGLTQPQWDAKTPEQQAALVNRMLNTSIGSAALYTTATAINLTVSAVFRDDPENMHLAGVYAARDVRNIVYAVGRDSLQAMFGMTSRTAGDNPTNGVTPGRLAMAALTYGAVQSVISLANTEGIEDILPGGIELKSGAVLRANSAARNAGQSMSDVLEANGTDIHRLQFEIAFLRGATNAPGEVIDALQLPIHEAYLAGGTSHVEWEPQLSDGRDVTRLASHSVVRVDWNKVAGTSDPLLSLWRPSSDDHTDIKKYTSPVIGGALWGVTYAPVAQLYQAHASVRREMRRLDDAAQDHEMLPLPVTISEPSSLEMSPPRQGVDHPLSGAGGSTSNSSRFSSSLRNSRDLSMMVEPSTSGRLSMAGASSRFPSGRLSTTGQSSPTMGPSSGRSSMTGMPPRLGPSPLSVSSLDQQTATPAVPQDPGRPALRDLAASLDAHVMSEQLTMRLTGRDNVPDGAPPNLPGTSQPAAIPRVQPVSTEGMTPEFLASIPVAEMADIPGLQGATSHVEDDATTVYESFRSPSSASDSDADSFHSTTPMRTEPDSQDDPRT
ncbi:hypothetical protein [Rhizobacter sp. Root1221]|uniref:hypothetical protein n=1 Tax=Rhizobacter sp. Root1221 TaxID=1736433 RepID=UPI0006F2EC3A|nr:hypothetical protein [Rhizobacter sp. Root1221]KQV99276.1 hypothetical protein ASC87_21040 [Rhizobacter sp. Root1221]